MTRSDMTRSDIVDADIADLGAESGAAGDLLQAALCALALGDELGDELGEALASSSQWSVTSQREARAECARVIREARAS